MRMENLRGIIAMLGLTSFVLLAPSDRAQVGMASERVADPRLRPALPVHAWDGREQITGLLVFTSNGEFHFSELLREESKVPAHDGYWIESWKIDALRTLMPAALGSFCVAEEMVIGNVVYTRVQRVGALPMWPMPKTRGK